MPQGVVGGCRYVGKAAAAVFGNQKVFPERCLKMDAEVRFKTLVLTGT